MTPNTQRQSSARTQSSVRRRHTHTTGHKKTHAQKTVSSSSRTSSASASRSHAGNRVTRTSPHSGTKSHAPSQKRGHAPRNKKAHPSKSSPSRTRTPRAPRPSAPKPNKPTTLNLPPVGDNVRIIPLGGVEEVGLNMTVVEYGNDILIFDVGFQFTEEATPGIDYLLPNTKYLEDRKDRIRGVVITHGHLDHIGGIPYIMDRIGNPPIYTRALTELMIRKRQEEFPHLPALNIKLVEPGETITLGTTRVEFFPVTHSIPDSMGASVKTKYGNIVISGDLKLDHEGGEATDAEKKTWGHIGSQNNLLFIADSTNVENPGFSITERHIHHNLEEIIKTVPDRLIIGTFASQFARLIKLIELSEKHGKKVVVDGRSIKTNIEIAKKANLLKVKPDTIIPIEDIEKYPSRKLVVLATGAQGEEFAVLMRIANKSHKFLRFTPKDTVVLSSSVIPGNEISVQRLKDNLYRHDIHLIHYRVSDVHSTGHGNAGELAWINKQVGAKYFMPGYGYHSMLRVHAQVIHEHNGFPKERIIIPDDGTIIDIGGPDKKLIIQKEKAPSNVVMVDGFSVGESQEVVLRDRQALAQDGILMIVALVDMKTGALKKSPDIISRGFVYLRDSQDLLRETRGVVKHTIEKTLVGMHPINFEFVKGKVTDDVARFLLQKTAKRPMVIPVLLGV
jgi:ribonuclease J